MIYILIWLLLVIVMSFLTIGICAILGAIIDYLKGD